MVQNEFLVEKEQERNEVDGWGYNIKWRDEGSVDLSLLSRLLLILLMLLKETKQENVQGGGNKSHLAEWLSGVQAGKKK